MKTILLVNLSSNQFLLAEYLILQPFDPIYHQFSRVVVSSTESHCLLNVLTYLQNKSGSTPQHRDGKRDPYPLG